MNEGQMAQFTGFETSEDEIPILNYEIRHETITGLKTVDPLLYISIDNAKQFVLGKNDLKHLMSILEEIDNV